MRLIEILPLFLLIRRIMWKKPGLNYLENCDSLHLSFVRFIDEQGKFLLCACKDFFFSGGCCL